MLVSQRKRRPRPMAFIEASGRRRARQNDRPCPVPVQIRTKVWIERDGGFVIGEGGLRLLLEVVAQGSLLAASREIGWSYRHAWQYLRRAEQALGFALVTPRSGKGARRGTKVTPEGHSVLQMLERARARLDRSAGPSGLTVKEIAARGAGRRRPPVIRSP